MLRFMSGLLIVMLAASIGLAQPPTGKEGGLNVKGKLTDEDAKDKVQNQSYHKVHTYKMEKGKTYQIDLVSRAFDSFLRLEDSDGKELATDDDGGGGLNSRISFSPKKTGEYRVIVTTFDPGKTGAYTLTARVPTGAEAELQVLQSDHRQAMQELSQRYSKSKDEKEKARILEEFQGIGPMFAPKALAFAKKHAKEPVGDQAIVWLMNTLNYGEAARVQYETAFKADKKKAEKVFAESIATLKKLGKDHPNFKKATEDAIYMIKNLSVGKKAPEIVAEDIDGVKFKLSDYRGKVVVVDFWGDW